MEVLGSPGLKNFEYSLVAQLVKNPPVMWETWVQTLGWEEPLEKGTSTHFSIQPGECIVHASQRVGHDTTERLSVHFTPGS